MLDRLLTRPEQALLLQQVRNAYPGGVLTSLHGSSASLAVALLYRDAPAPTLVVGAGLEDAEALATDLATLLPEARVLHVPESEILPYDTKSPYKGLVGQQVEALHQIDAGGPCLVVTSAKGLAWKVLPPSEIRDYTLRFQTGDELDLEATLERCTAMGYYAAARVESPGDLARKGGILDIFSVSHENPLRIELLGDTIESIRFFDATTQRSLRETVTATVPPCSSLILSDANVARAVEAVRAVQHGSAAQRERVAEHMAERLHFDGMERYAAFYSPRALLTDFMGGDARLVWVRPQAIVDALRRLQTEIEVLFEDCVRGGDPVPQPAAVYAGAEDLIALAELLPTLYLNDLPWKGDAPPLEMLRQPLAPEDIVPRRSHTTEPPADLPPELLEDFGMPPVSQSSGKATPHRDPVAARLRRRVPTAPRSIPDSIPPRVVRLEVAPPSPYAGNIPELQRDLTRRVRLGQRVHVVCDNEGQAERLREILDEIADDLDFPVGELQAGFALPTLGNGVLVLTDREIFHRYRKRQRRRKYRVAQGTSAYQDLQPGDFVVHIVYGIARYLGIKTIQIEGNAMDCLELLFADGDKIFVTVDQINLVEKYIGKEGVAPQLTKLGGATWARARAKAQAAIADMAKELLELAAVRASRRGHAFATDGHLQRELEAAFLYDETPDQLTAIDDVKHDMEREQPMDRLICGDVGYGKTEVAIRGAFKAVADGRQVAVLVPTTILAQQHLATFRERLAGFPVHVEMLSRLRGPKEAKEILERLATGNIDIIIGTHRLLSKDVQFKSIGLIVVDEEHRFGVGHKERLKLLKQTVDSLSMTATPIPRTLNMALVGLRDMSLIETAPRDRLPVQTEILPFDEETIVDAMLRELDRDGQIYFVHNRIESIDAMAGYLRRIVPHARIAIGHGQMDEHHLEKVMLDFLERKSDVLVSTMIIESGLDIPNVNTLIVNRADRLGLAQLYQLRGRVGRSSHKAYAYFMVPRGGTTTELARKRLAVLQEFEALGSGLKIAMRDLEIRGAGNILGQQQHGHLVAIGFELYCKLLEQTIAELSGREMAEEIATKVEIDADYLIPESYVPDPEEKMQIYKRLAAMTLADEVGPLRAELVDRYGALPETAAALLDVAALRLRAWHAGVERVRVRAGKVDFTMRAGHVLDRAAIESIVKASPNKLGFEASNGFKIIQHLKGGERMPQVHALLELLEVHT